MKHTLLYTLLGVAMLTASCSILDTNPDTRTTIDSKKKVQLLLGSAFSEANPNVIAELSSDNMIDNNAPTASGQVYTIGTWNQVCHQLFAFQDVNTGINQDSPHYLWQGDYKAIATCNQALQAIEDLVAAKKYTEAELANEKGEALITRAWHHFRLAQIFCQAYGGKEWNDSHLGLVYMTKPETTVHPSYHRETLAQTYQHIEADIAQGLELLTDDSYMTVPRYHFNVMAAHAFAARFYLYTRQWDKVIEQANIVLGTDRGALAAKLFDAEQATLNTPSPEQEVYVWIDGMAQYNLHVQTSMSSQVLLHQSSYGRYNLNGDAKNYSVSGKGPCWTSSFPGIRKWSYKSEYGVFVAKILYFFEYTNKIASTGYRHTMLVNFTTNETLLCRAEAYSHKGKYQEALEDLQLWCQKYNIKQTTSPISTLTDDKIRTFYKLPKTTNVLANRSYTPSLHNQELDPEWTINNEAMPYIYCCLHFRRIETMHEGVRFQDLKRYAIEWEHIIGAKADRKFMCWNDDRRAVQLPEAVILEGIEANPRTVVGENVTPNIAPAETYSGDPDEAEVLANQLKETITEVTD